MYLELLNHFNYKKLNNTVLCFRQEVFFISTFNLLLANVEKRFFNHMILPCITIAYNSKLYKIYTNYASYFLEISSLNVCNWYSYFNRLSYQNAINVGIIIKGYGCFWNYMNPRKKHKTKYNSIGNKKRISIFKYSKLFALTILNSISNVIKNL